MSCVYSNYYQGQIIKKHLVQVFFFSSFFHRRKRIQNIYDKSKWGQPLDTHTHTQTEQYKQKEGCCVPGLKVPLTFNFQFTAKHKTVRDTNLLLYINIYLKITVKAGIFFNIFYKLSWQSKAKHKFPFLKHNMSMWEIIISPPSGGQWKLLLTLNVVWLTIKTVFLSFVCFHF